jgi:hypothetical protein
MPRYIDADEVLETMRSNMDMQELYLPIHFIDFVIEDMPTADVQPVKHGRWMLCDDGYIRCSECKSKAFIENDETIATNFCHSCGANMRMDGDGE